jgi:hypothetical protein
MGARQTRREASARLAGGGRALDLGNEAQGHARDDIAKLRWLHPYLGDKQLDEIDRTLIDHQVRPREDRHAGTTNRYLALIRAILRRACHEWEWIDRVPKIKLFKEAEGRVRSLTPQEFEKLLNELPEHLADMAVFSA